MITPSVFNGVNSLLMQCTAVSIPSPSYEIWKDSEQISIGTPGADESFNYTIKDVQFYHDGNYTCTAFNKHGSHDITKSVAVSGKTVMMHN